MALACIFFETGFGKIFQATLQVGEIEAVNSTEVAEFGETSAAKHSQEHCLTLTEEAEKI